MLIKNLLKKYSDQIDNLDLELIIARVLKKTREFVIAHPEFEIRRLKKWKIEKLINRRKEGMPLAYLTGHKEFYGLDFLVNKNVLVPRPETEMVVEEVIRIINSKQLTTNKTILLDVGTGSGCIPISILKSIKTLKHKNIKLFAIDISKKALKTAKKNANKHKTNIQFLHGNLLEPIFNNKQSPFDGYELIITANLPYLTEEQYKNEASIQFEPKSALVAKNNGLELYEQLFKQIKNFDKNSHSKITILLEIDPFQTQSIISLIKKHLPQADVKKKKDLSGKNRVVKILLE